MPYLYSAAFALQLCFSATCVADNTQHLQLVQKIDRAIGVFEKTQQNEWSYKLSRYENEEGEITQSIEQYSPALNVENAWTLISTNKKAPTKKEQKKFINKKKQRENNKKSKNSFYANLRELIDIEALKLVTNEGDHIIMSFPVQIAKLGDDAIDKLTGKLRYNKQEQYIEEISIVNNAEFSPMFSASITSIELSFSFVKIDSAILPFQNKLNMKGRFAFVTKIDETSTDTFSDYQYLGELVK